MSPLASPLASGRRIVSLVPSLTELVCALGAQAEVVGCTGFCVRPAGLWRSAEKIGGTKDPGLERIAALRPTHILVNEEENKPEHIAACRGIAPTLVTFPKSPRDVPELVRGVAGWLGGDEERRAGEAMAGRIEAALRELDGAVREATADGRWRARRYLYLIWREPYMVAAADTYIDATLALVGWTNAAPAGNRYPEMTVAGMQAARPEALLLSSEPYPFRNRDAERLAGEWSAGGATPPELWKFDGQLGSWYGALTEAALQELARWVRGEPQHVAARVR